jgi:hypothetical protein
VEGPVEVRQTLRLAADRHVRVRLPDWAASDRVVARAGDGAKLVPAVEGRYLNFGKLSQGSEFIITYPLQTRITQECVGGDGCRTDFTPTNHRPTYTVQWKGNRVVSMRPVGHVLPIFPES